MRNLFFLLILSTILFGVSCNQEPVVSELENVKEEAKLAFLENSIEDQKVFWINRLESSMQLNLEVQQKEGIKKVIEEIKSFDENEFYLSQSLIKEAVNVASLLSEDTYLDIFSTTSTLSKTVHNGVICEGCINDLKSYEIETKTIMMGKVMKDKYCNCRWNCGGDISVCTHGNCTATRHGCGFLWLQSCDQRDEIFPNGNCA